MPKFIHERAKHILAKNPSMPTSEAFGIATQQSHALGKTPKGYGTPSAKWDAKEKYDTPSDDEKKANPGNLTSPKLAAKDLIPGGLADKGPPKNVDPSQISKGIKVELEHTNSRAIAHEIANDHLTEDPKYYDKLEKVEKQANAVAILGGLAAGISPGRNVAGETAAALSPEGRVTRSENIARQAAFVGAPAGALGALALAKKYNLEPAVAAQLAKRFPGGLITDPHTERQVLSLVLPAALAVGGSIAGGAVTGVGTGLLQQLRGTPTRGTKKEASVIDELQKMGAVTEQEARRSLDRLDSLERSRPTLPQVGRYAAIGAIAGPTIRAATNVIRGKSPLDFGQAAGVSALRGAAADMVGGAASAGALPILRQHLDRKAEIGNLRKFMQQHEAQQQAEEATPTPVAPAKVAGLSLKTRSLLRHATWDADKQALGVALGKKDDVSDRLKKVGFQQSMYGSTGGFVDFGQVSSIPPFKKPSLASPLPQKTDNYNNTSVKEAMWDVWFEKTAAGMPIGQWWDNVGGPHLAKGGSTNELRKMMEREGFDKKTIDRFEVIGKKRYGEGTRRATGGGASRNYSHGEYTPPTSADSAEYHRKWEEYKSQGKDPAKEFKKQRKGSPMNLGIPTASLATKAVGALSGVAGLGYMLGGLLPNSLQKKITPSSSEAKAKAIQFMDQVPTGALWGSTVGEIVGAATKGFAGQQHGAAIGAAAGAALGALQAVHSHSVEMDGVEYKAKQLAKRDNALRRAEKELDAQGPGWALSGVGKRPGSLLLSAYVQGLGGTGDVVAGGALSGLADRMYHELAVQKAKELKEKTSALTATGITPAARLSSSMRIGKPKVTAPAGPSVADIAKPIGYGRKLPGATKTATEE